MLFLEKKFSRIYKFMASPNPLNLILEELSKNGKKFEYILDKTECAKLSWHI